MTEVPPEEFRVRVEPTEGGKFQVTYEKVSNEPQKESPYAHLGNHLPAEPTTIRMGEPIFLNPCSYDALVLVLRDIGRQAGVRQYGGSREWLPVMCDGLPYHLCSQIIERYVICSTCHHTCNGMDEMERHAVSQHSGVNLVSCHQEFSWVLLQPGPGHIEMNMLKGFVKLMWDVYWEDMVEVFNFKSENAKKSAKSVSDHHKGFTLARISRESVARELVTPYVRQELADNPNHPNLSVAGFFKFCMTCVKNPNFAFLFNTHVELLDAIFGYRAGLRSGHAALVEAARGSFAKLWSGQYHPMYRQLDAYDAITTLCMPQKLRDTMKSACSFNTSGIPFTGEGGDFKLEELNKAVQQWIPSRPKPEDWRMACSNYSHLTKLRETAFSQMGVQDPKSKRVRIPSDISQQVMAFRAVLRERGYLTQPGTAMPHTSLSGKPLDHGLVDFCAEATRKHQRYIHTFLEKRENLSRKQCIPFDEPPVFVTPEERAAYEHISNKPVHKIHSEVVSLVESVTDIEMQAEFNAEYAAMKKRKALKAEYVDFHNLVTEYVELQVCVDDLPVDDVNESSSDWVLAKWSESPLVLVKVLLHIEPLLVPVLTFSLWIGSW